MSQAAKKVAAIQPASGPETTESAGLLRERARSYDEHRASLGALPTTTAQALAAAASQHNIHTRDQHKRPLSDQLERHGKAGFTTLVVNACEPDPLHGHVAQLCSTNPHLVLDGAELLASALAIPSVVVVTASSTTATNPLDAAVQQRTDSRNLRWNQQKNQGAFTNSRDTALIQQSLGGLALPKPSATTERLMNKRRSPTVVYSAETCAALALALLTPSHQATHLATVRFGRNVVFEIPTHEPLGRYLPNSTADQVVLIGGAEGQWTTVGKAASLTADPATWTAAGLAAAHTSVWLPGEHECPVAITSRLLHFLASQSTGQCGPCINGVPALAHAFDRAAGADHLNEVASIGRLISGRGACSTPDSATRLALSAVALLQESFSDHISEKCGCGVSDA